MKIELSKYTFRAEPGECCIRVDRDRTKDWAIFRRGSGAIYSLMAEYLVLCDDLKKYKDRAMALKGED